MLNDPPTSVRNEAAHRARGCLRFAMNGRYDFSVTTSATYPVGGEVMRVEGDTLRLVLRVKS
ncbi:hypothetical protein [Nitrosococcus watsonii]|uniref:hypothetical protein n=1 Tax=Nitrosococcus watsonii TaxID=473531 RepID=UPI0002F409FB|nr:hypothetical protein [Nitrosococcus watsonii]